jgi:hypothetical protein
MSKNYNNRLILKHIQPFRSDTMLGTDNLSKVDTPNVPITKTMKFQQVPFSHFVIWYSNLFRVSNFDIRILPEHDFSFRHYRGAEDCPRGSAL